ncbi:MAG: ATP-binding protein, partial [Elusimicrobia bacterium]|nr:ATP-binding protein [Elusimicrobiota bacterium]
MIELQSLLMLSNFKKFLTLFLCAILVYTCPGLEPYRAFAQFRTYAAKGKYTVGSLSPNVVHPVAGMMLQGHLLSQPLSVSLPLPLQPFKGYGQIRVIKTRMEKLSSQASSENLKSLSGWEKSVGAGPENAGVEGAAMSLTSQGPRSSAEGAAREVPSARGLSLSIRPALNLRIPSLARGISFSKKQAILPALSVVGALVVAHVTGFLDPTVAIFVLGGVSIRCMEPRRWEEERAVQQAIQQEQRRIQAFQELRNKLWERTQQMEMILVQKKTRVLIDRELVTEGALEALVRSYKDSWEKWSKELPVDSEAAKADWKAQFTAYLKENLSFQGLLTDPETLDQIIQEEMPNFLNIVEEWEKEYSAAATLYQSSQEWHAQAKAAQVENSGEGEVHFQAQEQKIQAEVSQVEDKSHQKEKKKGSQVALKRVLPMIVWMALGGSLLYALGSSHALWGGSLTLPVFLGAVVMAGATLDEFLKNIGVDRKETNLFNSIFKDLSSIRPLPFAGRPKLVAQILSVLSQKEGGRKGILLVGQQGVGKGALVGHIASEIGMGTYPLDMKFLELDVSKFSTLASQMSSNPDEKSLSDKFFDSIL